MMERALAEYIVNALWQVPLLAGGAWLLIRVARPGPQMQHRVWLAVLGLALLLPMYRMGRTGLSAKRQPQQTTAVTQVQPVSRQEPLGRLARNDGQSAQKHRLEFPFHVQMHTMRLTATGAHWLVRLYLGYGGLRLASYSAGMEYNSGSG
jgi:hypothetical protein